MKIKNICIISKGYPSEKNAVYTFVEQLVNKFSDNDINCYVISPQSLTKSLIRGRPLNKRLYYRYNENGKKITVYSPMFLSFSNYKKIINTHYINIFNFRIATNKIFTKLNKKIKFDVIYAHFILPSAIVANELGKKYNIPVFFAYGENNIYPFDCIEPSKIKERLKGIKGVIAVSNSNKNRLIENKIISEELIKVFPNAINNKIFYKKDKRNMREKLGYSEKDFIITFVGGFNKRKGITRLCEALININNNNIKAIFIGKGELEPDYENIIFKGELNQLKIVDYLSASDIFVLPTNAEGCSNAVIEALACGLPVISSNQDFNDEILDDNCSIRINSMNVEEIKLAIEKLYTDESLRKKLSEGALEKAKNFSIEDRAKKIINYMEKRIEGSIG